MEQAERDKLHEQGIWVTKDLRQVPIAQMETSWLLNIAKQLVKVAKAKSLWEFEDNIASAYAFLGTLNGEMAQYSMESEIANMEENGEPRPWIFYLWDEPFYRPLAEELRKRGETKTLDRIKYPEEDSYEEWLEPRYWKEYIKGKLSE